MPVIARSGCVDSYRLVIGRCEQRNAESSDATGHGGAGGKHGRGVGGAEMIGAVVAGRSVVARVLRRNHNAEGNPGTHLYRRRNHKMGRRFARKRSHVEGVADRLQRSSWEERQAHGQGIARPCLVRAEISESGYAATGVLRQRALEGTGAAEGAA